MTQLIFTLTRHNLLNWLYFNQGTYAFASAQVVENNEKHLKIIKKLPFHHVDERLM